jgi:hypothetical protein
MLTAGKFGGYSTRELQREAEGEVIMRRRVYENRVLTGRMTRQAADTKINRMKAIAEYFAELAEKDRLL